MSGAAGPQLCHVTVAASRMVVSLAAGNFTGGRGRELVALQGGGGSAGVASPKPAASAAAQPLSEFVLACHDALELVVIDDDQRLVTVARQPLFATVRAIGSVPTQCAMQSTAVGLALGAVAVTKVADRLAVACDSGRVTLLTFQFSTKLWTRETLNPDPVLGPNPALLGLTSLTFGKSGCRRGVAGHYLAVDRRARCLMVGALQRQKLVFPLQVRTFPDGAEQVSLMSPLDASKPGSTLFACVAVDNVSENALFACLEHVDGEMDDGERHVVLYEHDGGLNHVLRLWSSAVNRTASLLVPVPLTTVTPPGCVLVCGEDTVAAVTYDPARATSRIIEQTVPRRADYPIESPAGVLITAHASVKVRDNKYFLMVQNELGDLFRVEVRRPASHSDVAAASPGDVTVRYFDTVPVASHLLLTRRGQVFVASESGPQHALFKIIKDGYADDSYLINRFRVSRQVQAQGAAGGSDAAAVLPSPPTTLLLSIFQRHHPAPKHLSPPLSVMAFSGPILQLKSRRFGPGSAKAAGRNAPPLSFVTLHGRAGTSQLGQLSRGYRAEEQLLQPIHCSAVEAAWVIGGGSFPSPTRKVPGPSTGGRGGVSSMLVAATIQTPRLLLVTCSGDATAPFGAAPSMAGGFGRTSAVFVETSHGQFQLEPSACGFVHEVPTLAAGSLLDDESGRTILQVHERGWRLVVLSVADPPGGSGDGIGLVGDTAGGPSTMVTDWSHPYLKSVSCATFNGRQLLVGFRHGGLTYFDYDMSQQRFVELQSVDLEVSCLALPPLVVPAGATFSRFSVVKPTFAGVGIGAPAQEFAVASLLPRPKLLNMAPKRLRSGAEVTSATITVVPDGTVFAFLGLQDGRLTCVTLDKLDGSLLSCVDFTLAQGSPTVTMPHSPSLCDPAVCFAAAAGTLYQCGLVDGAVVPLRVSLPPPTAAQSPAASAAQSPLVRCAVRYHSPQFPSCTVVFPSDMAALAVYFVDSQSPWESQDTPLTTSTGRRVALHPTLPVAIVLTCENRGLTPAELAGSHLNGMLEQRSPCMLPGRHTWGLRVVDLQTRTTRSEIDPSQLDPSRGTVANGSRYCTFNEAALSLCLCPFSELRGAPVVVVGVAPGFVPNPLHCVAEGGANAPAVPYLATFTVDKDGQLSLASLTAVTQLPSAMLSLQGMLLVALGSSVALYAWGRKRLLWKTDVTIMPDDPSPPRRIVQLAALNSATSDVIAAADVHESVHLIKYAKDAAGPAPTVSRRSPTPSSRRTPATRSGSLRWSSSWMGGSSPRIFPHRTRRRHRLDRLAPKL